MDNILDNIGLPYQQHQLHLQQLRAHRRRRCGHPGLSQRETSPDRRLCAHSARARCPASFPAATFYFLPADIVTQTLNFGLPAPIDIQIDGRISAGNRAVADKMLTELRHVRGITDLRIQQQSDYPKFHIDVDRTKAAQGGFTERDIANSLLISLSGSFQVTPMFYLNPKNGVSATTWSRRRRNTTFSRGQDLQNIPISGPNQKRPAILADVASIQRTSELAVDQPLQHPPRRRYLRLRCRIGIWVRLAAKSAASSMRIENRFRAEAS